MSHLHTSARAAGAAELFEHKLAVLKRLGIEIEKGASVLDFGCGAGETVYALLDKGYDARGFDVVDYLQLRDESDRHRFRISESGLLPFPDETFDLIISDQVFEHVQDQPLAFSEMHRVLKEGGSSVHVIPAKYQIIEPHIYVPLGGLIGRRAYYKLWALTGIRNEFQQGMPADEVADRNAEYFATGLKYIGNSDYRRMWKSIGFEYAFSEVDYMETSGKERTRKLGRAARAFPLITWAVRTFIARIVVLHRPAADGRESTRAPGFR